jgi:hypothetical protein
MRGSTGSSPAVAAEARAHANGRRAGAASKLRRDRQKRHIVRTALQHQRRLRLDLWHNGAAMRRLSRTRRCGARLLAWAAGPGRWLDGVERGDFCGW